LAGHHIGAVSHLYSLLVLARFGAAHTEDMKLVSWERNSVLMLFPECHNLFMLALLEVEICELEEG
jgi:hypothetical protein